MDGHVRLRGHELKKTVPGIRKKTNIRNNMDFLGKYEKSRAEISFTIKSLFNF